MAFGRVRNRNQIKSGNAGRDPAGPEPAEHGTPPQPAAEKRIQSAAVKMLAARSRSEAELKYLLRQKFRESPEEVDACIERLRQTGLVNDARFAEYYAGHRTSTKAIGPERLARELASRKVPPDIIQTAVASVYSRDSQDELIDKAIQKRLRTRGHDPGAAGQRRMMQHLARLGFDTDLIIRKVRELTKGGTPKEDSDGLE